MPKASDQFDLDDDLYNETKGLRSSKTNKRLRRLRAFERVYYKKTCEVKKTGHGLSNEHQLNDGNLRYSPRNLTYSLNKKKRWLLPEIIEQRICEHDPNPCVSLVKKGDQIFTIDERLKIVMYENENTRHKSTCVRYGNNQTEPHIVHKNGRRFNSETLTKWMDFDTRERRARRRRTHRVDGINQPNFGIQQRPGFFPSEVTYEFLYPKRLPSAESRRDGKTSLTYASMPRKNDWGGRYFKDTNKNRRKVRRNECMEFDIYEQECCFPEEEEDMDDNECIISSSDLIDEDERWSIAFDDCDDQFLSYVDFPIDYFIPSPPSSCKSPCHSNENLSDIVIDRKANKHFESPPPTVPDEQTKKPAPANEHLLCSILCEDDSNFLSLMQQSNMKISQANLSPPIFLQRTTTSSFSVIYTYCQTSCMANATLKYTDLPPNISVDQNQNQIILNELIELISKKLDEIPLASKTERVKNYRIDVNALRGSLPLPKTISQNMLLVKPNSTDRQTALETENLIEKNQNQVEQWFDIIKNEYEMFECSICCEVLTSNDTYQLLPCHHTLCHPCLTSYIRTSVSSATYSSSSTSPITCFQPNCSTQLNATLLQAFVSYDIYHSYRQALIERHLFSSGHYRQCPSRACSNLLIVDDNTKTSLMCWCGQRVCSACLQEYHFPATCKQYKTYEARLRQSSDHLLSASKVGDDSHCYIAEGKNCPSCGEFVEKNGGCPHMTCKCGNEYCWACLKRWSTHNFAACRNIPESTHELRSSSRSRFYNKALSHRRQRNQPAFNLLESQIRKVTNCSDYHNLFLSTYIDLNTLAEFIYVLMQRRRINGNIRAVLGQTASRLEVDAFRIKLQAECKQIKKDYLDQIRLRLERTVLSLSHMKKNKVLL